MNPHYVRDMLVRGVADHPAAVAEVLRRQVNQGVFSNGQKNEVHGQDVFEFLDGVEGDILYLDPPYAGTSAYETSLRPLDSMLEGRLVRAEPSRFSRRGGTGDAGAATSRRASGFRSGRSRTGTPRSILRRSSGRSSDSGPSSRRRRFATRT